MAIKNLSDVYKEKLFTRKGLKTLRRNLDENGRVHGFGKAYVLDHNSKSTYSITDISDGSKFKNIPLEYFKAGIFQIVNDKIVPGPNANKRMIKTKDGFKTFEEVQEDSIKRRLYNELAFNHADNLYGFNEFKHMSLDEIDSHYDPTKRAYWNFQAGTDYPTERFYEKRRLRWKKYAKKHGKWWLDQAKKEIDIAKKRGVVDYDKNFLSMYFKSFGHQNPQSYQDSKFNKKRSCYKKSNFKNLGGNNGKKRYKNI